MNFYIWTFLWKRFLHISFNFYLVSSNSWGTVVKRCPVFWVLRRTFVLTAWVSRSGRVWSHFAVDVGFNQTTNPLIQQALTTAKTNKCSKIMGGEPKKVKLLPLLLGRVTIETSQVNDCSRCVFSVRLITCLVVQHTSKKPLKEEK